MLHRLGEAVALPKSLHGYKETPREFHFRKMRIKAFMLESKVMC